jgi:hypothetical protein
MMILLLVLQPQTPMATQPLLRMIALMMKQLMMPLPLLMKKLKLMLMPKPMQMNK